jgi:NTE family protein
LAEHVRNHIVINIGKHTKSVASAERLFKVLTFLLEDDLLENTRIPFAAVATDLYKGSEVILETGPIIRSVAASSALPAYLPPVSINGLLLVDGASTSPVPIRAAKKLSKKKVLAVDVSQTLPDQPKLDNLVDIVLRSYSITARRYHDELVHEADLLLQPLVGQFHWSQFDTMDLFIKEGEKTISNSLDDIYKLLS